MFVSFLICVLGVLGVLIFGLGIETEEANGEAKTIGLVVIIAGCILLLFKLVRW